MSHDSDNTEQENPEQEAQKQSQKQSKVIKAQAAKPSEPVADPDTETTDESGPQLSIVPVEPLSAEHIRCVLEAALLAADDALTIDRLFKLFVPGELAEEGAKAQVREAITELAAACEGRGFELKKVASGYRMQVRQNLSPWVSRLWEEKPPRYTRALLETMSLIAYKQPATRGDIEEVRGVTVSSNIMRTLLERGWIREVGQRDVPGRPSMYGTTKEFLDYFNLSSLDELPSLPEIRELVEPASATPDEAPEPREETRSDVTKALLEQDVDGPVTPSEVDAEALTEAASEAVPSAPVFTDDEVLVVSETAEAEVRVEVQSDASIDASIDELAGAEVRADSKD